MVFFQVVKKAMQDVWKLTTREAETEYKAGIHIRQEEADYELQLMKASVSEEKMQRYNERLARKAAKFF